MFQRILYRSNYNILPIISILNNSRSRNARKYFSTNISKKFWNWTTTNRVSWKENIKEASIACIIFGTTGSLTMFVLRPCLKSIFGIEGTLIDGPNSYRVISILCISPIYALTLLCIGTILGRHIFFAKMSMKILGRFIPSKILHNIYCTPAKMKLK